MNEMQRYELDWAGPGDEPTMRKDSLGGYVRFDDCAVILAEKNQEIAQKVVWIKQMKEDVDFWRAAAIENDQKATNKDRQIETLRTDLHAAEARFNMARTERDSLQERINLYTDTKHPQAPAEDGSLGARESR